jgi:hypothetical protein
MDTTSNSPSDSSTHISRRKFLGLMGYGAAAVALPPSILWGVEQLASKVDHVAEISLNHDVQSGKYSREKLGIISNLEQFNTVVLDNIESLSTLSQCHLLVVKDEEDLEITYGSTKPIFFPASTIKVPLCYEAYKLGLQTRQQYLTPSLAQEILENSSTFIDMLMRLPLAKGKRPEQLEEIVREVLTKANIPPHNNVGELPLRVNIYDEFNYLLEMDLPDLMKEAMLQKPTHYNRNYGVSTAILQNTKHKLPAYFKVGLINDPDTGDKELVNTYYLQLGNGFKMLGYAQGPDIYDVHSQMLHAAACAANIAVT